LTTFGTKQAVELKHETNSEDCLKMRLCRFLNSQGQVKVGVTYDGNAILDLGPAGVERLDQLLEMENFAAHLTRMAGQTQTRHSIRSVRLLPPTEQQEVWGAGVTYLRSKTARMEESNFNAAAYDKVYEATRPELFFKSLPEKVVAPGEAVGIRKDTTWNVPEPELALMLNSKGKIVGYTIGNDMSARDLEGENSLYLPQAKTYARSCALGPFVAVGVLENDVRTWSIHLRIQRGTSVVFKGETSLGQIKRPFTELASFLFRSQVFPHGAVLLTGTGIVPPTNFTLQAGDNIQITINGIGTLDNSVVLV
jgi:2-dehydro-3-deoxy-D-arabinonate dehydratase